MAIKIAQIQNFRQLDVVVAVPTMRSISSSSMDNLMRGWLQDLKALISL
jgi:hypothetical protein